MITTHAAIVTIVSPEMFSLPPAKDKPFHLITDGNVCAFAPEYEKRRILEKVAYADRRDQYGK